MRMLFLKINIEIIGKYEKFEISNFLISYLGLTNINLDSLILVILNNLSKETLFYKNDNIDQFFTKLFHYYKSLDFNIFKFNDIAKIGSIFKNYVLDFLTYSTLLNLFLNFYYIKPKIIDSELTIHIVQTLSDQLKIILSNNKNTTEKIKETFKNKLSDDINQLVEFIDKNRSNLITSILQTINSVYVSENLEPSIKLYIDKLTIIYSEELIVYLTEKERNQLMSFEISSFQDKDLIVTIMHLFKNCLSSLYFYKLEEISSEIKEFLEKLYEVIKIPNRNYNDIMYLQNLEDLSKFLIEKLKFKK